MTVLEAHDGALTAAERVRFSRANGGDEEMTTEALAAYLDWRRATLPLPKDAPRLGHELPMMVHFLEGVRSKSGHRILVVLGAMYDNTVYTGQHYADAIVEVMDAQLDRDSEEKVVVLLDVRGGDGWYNPRPWSILPLVRACANTLQPNYPERLHQLVVMPVPWVFKTLWTAASQVLAEETAQKCVILSGPAGNDDPVPETMNEHLGADALAAFETFRAQQIKAAIKAAP